LVGALAITQTAGYGVLYYSFAPLLGPMSRDLRIGIPTAAGALTLAVLVTGAMAIPVGRWLDARGGRAVMTGGAVLGVAGVVWWSQVQSVVQLYGAFVVMGIASSMVLYPAATAVLVATFPPPRRTKAILAMTLVAGFASSVFIPLAGVLAAAFGWRRAVVVLAVSYAALAVPLHAVALRRAKRRSGGAVASPRNGRPRRVTRDPGFWLLALGNTLHAAANAAIGIHLVSYLVHLGQAPQLAATIAGLLGVFSVAGRITVSIASRWMSMLALTATVYLLQGVAMAILPAAGERLGAVVACVVAFGLGFGVASIATPILVVDRFGSGGYGTVAGVLSTPTTLAKAAAPLGGAFLAEAAGYTALIVVVAACLLASGLAIASVRLFPPPQRDPP
jgi:predicted MFS family arabinose efflux permease